MSARFKFDYNGVSYEVIGTYGTGAENWFTVTVLVPGATRMLGAQGAGPHGTRVEKAFKASDEAELKLELAKTYGSNITLQPF